MRLPEGDVPVVNFILCERLGSHSGLPLQIYASSFGFLCPFWRGREPSFLIKVDHLRGRSHSVIPSLLSPDSGSCPFNGLLYVVSRKDAEHDRYGCSPSIPRGAPPLKPQRPHIRSVGG